jgi:hypothetical protein
MVFTPHGKRTYGPPETLQGIALLFLYADDVRTSQQTSHSSKATLFAGNRTPVIQVITDFCKDQSISCFHCCSNKPCGHCRTKSHSQTSVLYFSWQVIPYASSVRWSSQVCHDPFDRPCSSGASFQFPLEPDETGGSGSGNR